jgi:hypothetical protein
MGSALSLEDAMVAIYQERGIKNLKKGIWKQRVEVTNEHGETYAEWQSPERIKNPFGLMAQE